MAKSKGNMVFVRDLLESQPPDAVRLYLLDTHYRSPLDFDEDALRSMAATAVRLARASHEPTKPSRRAHPGAGRHRQRFIAALDDDLDVRAAIAVLDELAGLVLSDAGSHAAYAAQRELRALAVRLGLSLESA
jgi:cysteinyl-tRNA synthetase